jgi:hypothetical protein
LFAVRNAATSTAMKAPTAAAPRSTSRRAGRHRPGGPVGPVIAVLLAAEFVYL